ncbi:MAG TPA: DUF3306 domain-containing protein [Aestuariivirgaceae bacterium]|nr:DUF3306 domain-containing protein [Aestuariivirgaceae bacterium]
MSKSGFLERWSRRKLAEGRLDETEPAPHDDDLVPAAAEATPVSDEPAEETLDEAELAQLPPIEAITVKTDLAPFLRKGVPQALKNAAMRKMWMLDPAIRDHKDFAVDYAWDWNTPGGVPGNAGSISGKSLARMLESLAPKPKQPADAQSDSPDEPPEAEKTAASAEPEAQSQSPHKAPDRVDSDAPDEMQPDHPERPGARTRRHGGAAPV